MAVWQTGKITDILLRNKVIDPENLKTAEEEAKVAGVRLEKYLVDRKLVKSDDMSLVISEYLKMPAISLAHFVPNEQILEIIPRETMVKRLIIPISRLGKHLTVAMGDPFDLLAIDELSIMTGFEITPLVASESEINQTLTRISKDSFGIDMQDIMKDESEVSVKEAAEEEESIESILGGTEAAPVIRIVDTVLMEAIRVQANGIHIEPLEKELQLRYRIDGILVKRPNPPKSFQSAIISRIKIMADMNIAERRIPQDGRFSLRAMGKRIDVRVSTIPTVHGEKIVMRLLDKTALFPNLPALGLDNVAFKALSYAIAQPHGIILVTGPTGSGKTTTLYSCLSELNAPNVNIVTCEEPVEYQIEGINQVQVNAAVGMTFASALRSILRQDPDIVLIGEVRDGETADIAIKAALTGHLVLATLHTNSAAGAITRLTSMGIEPFMLVAALLLSQAQRLFRKLCPSCKKPERVPKKLLETNKIDPTFFDGTTIYQAVGCPKCNNIGYKGRGAIMEVLLLDPGIKDAIQSGSNSAQIQAMAVKKGMVPLKHTGLMKVKEGVTSLKAALDVTGGE